MRSYAWPLLATLALTINACGSDQTATDAGVDGGKGGSVGSAGRGGGGGRGGTGGSATGTAGSTGGGVAGSTGGSTAGNGGATGGSTGTGGGTAGSTGGSAAGRGGTGGGTAGSTGGSTAGSGGRGGTGGGTAGSGGRGGTGGGTAGSTGGSTAGSGGRGGTGGGTAGSTGTGGSTAGAGGGTGGSTTGTGGGTAGSTGGSTAGSGGATGGNTGTGGSTGTGGTVACTNASTCPGGVDDECKQKTCVSNFCGIHYTAASTVVTGQTTGDCKRNVCDGAGGVMPAIFDSDTPADDGNACTSETCVNGTPTHAPEPVRTACTQGGGSYCNGSSSAPACVVCIAATDCPGTDSICHMRVCGNANTCGFVNAQAGTAAEVIAGNCRKEQCDGLGGTDLVTDDTDTPADDGNACTTDVCTSGTPTHPTKSDGTTCSQGSGIVCLTGSCVECRTVADCPGSDTTCRTRTCETNHTCGHMDAPLGTASGTDAAKNCKKPVCNGAGAVTSVADDTDLPVDDDPCTSDVCTSGTPSNPAKAAGTICASDGSKTCDSAGACNPLTFRVVHIGTGSAALDNSATQVYVEERKTDGTVVSSVTVPTATNGNQKALTMSGAANSEGALTLSGDGRYVVFAGYAATLGTSMVASTMSSVVNRVAGRIDATGNIDTSTAFAAAFNTNNARGATTTDGTEFWIAGAGGSAAGGVWYNTLGGGGETRILSTPNNVRTVSIINNQLYGSSGSSPFANVFSIGFGTPTTTGQTATVLPETAPPTGANPYAFAMFDMTSGADRLYVADEAIGIVKWTRTGTNPWTEGPALNVSGSTGFRGVAGYAVGSTVTLMATTSEANNRLVLIVDDGTNTPTVTDLLRAPTNTVFRGVAVSPHFP